MDAYTGLTPARLKSTLLAWFKSGDTKTVMFVEGVHGIGKTDILVEAALEHFMTEELKKLSPQEILALTEDERGFVLEREYPATKQVEDYTGIPYVKDGKTVWALPNCFSANKDAIGLLVIEELPQASEEIMNAFFPVFQDKKIGDHRLPRNVFIAVTGNPSNGVYNVKELPVALNDRVQKIGCVHSAKDWITWAKKNGINKGVIGFIQEYPRMIHVMQDDGTKGPSPRAWVAVARHMDGLEKGIYEEYMVVEFAKHQLGIKASSKFFGHYKHNFKKAVTVDELLKDFPTYSEKYKGQSSAGKVESMEGVMDYINDKVDSLDMKTLNIFSEVLCTMTPDSVLVAKTRSLDKEVINKLVTLGPAGVKIGHKLAAIRTKATNDDK